MKKKEANKSRATVPLNKLTDKQTPEPKYYFYVIIYLAVVLLMIPLPETPPWLVLHGRKEQVELLFTPV
jgi:hypothetical protein